MSDLDYDALRKVAEAATPGPWERPGANVFRVIAPEAEHRNKPFGKTPPYPWKIVADADPLGEPSVADAEHIAAFDPPTVLRLLDLAQRAEAAEALHRALFTVESKHQFHGSECVCGYVSDRSRSRTEHITAEIRAALDREEDQPATRGHSDAENAGDGDSGALRVTPGPSYADGIRPEETK